MIILPQVVTVGGTATFVFDLADAKQERLESVANGTATVSLRKTTTARTKHELTHLPAILDPVAATVTLKLTVAQVESLAPSITKTTSRQQMDVVGDVRIVQGAKINYFGPFLFSVRLPETYEGQKIRDLGFTVVGGLSADSTPDTAELTIPAVGHDVVFPPMRDQHQLIWRLATEPDLISVVYTSDTTFYNQIGNFLLWPHEVTLADGRRGKVLVSIQRLTLYADTLELR